MLPERSARRRTAAREDELSYVLAGTLTVWRAGIVTTADPGEVGAKPLRFLELVSPPTFAAYFRELGALMPAEGSPDSAALGALAERYGLDFDFTALGPLLTEHGLRLG